MNMVSDKELESMSKAVGFNSPEGGLSFIEQLQIVSSQKCSKDNRPYLTGVNENAKTAKLFQANCKMWDCEACAARNTRRWIAIVINGVNRIGGEWYMFTFTAHRHHRKGKSVINLRQGWKKLYNRILEKAKSQETTLYYCRVWEQHTDGSFHLHGLINVHLGKKWAKDNAAQCGIGSQADVHKVDNAGQVAGYISKYSLKNAWIARGGVEWPKGLRRIETSRNWPLLPEIGASQEWNWIFSKNRIAQLIKAQPYKDAGYQVIDLVTE